MFQKIFQFAVVFVFRFISSISDYFLSLLFFDYFLLLLHYSFMPLLLVFLLLLLLYLFYLCALAFGLCLCVFLVTCAEFKLTRLEGVYFRCVNIHWGSVCMCVIVRVCVCARVYYLVLYIYYLPLHWQKKRRWLIFLICSLKRERVR